MTTTHTARRRAALVCPGRGSYGREALGSLGRAAAGGERAQRLLEEAEAARRARGGEALAALDSTAEFDPARHLGPANASALTFVGGALEAELLAARGSLEVVAVGGNSLGWYTALAVAGALDFPSAFRLVETVAALQEAAETRRAGGGQVLYPVVDEEWRADEGRREAVERSLEAAGTAGGAVWRSIRYGAYEVLGGDARGLDALRAALPPVRHGGRDYPAVPGRHLAFHTPLMAGLSAAAREALADLAWAAPRLPLVDGRGVQWRPRWADPAALAAYTLGTQMVETFDLVATARVVLREYAPEVLVALGPGDTLGAALGAVLVEEGWSGVRSRSDFLERQRGDAPLVLSMGRPADRARLLS
ncbi:MAG: ACP S-malonyltransferase [Planctomycetes bacterium]|nr:ACP S-malonyltransferase [Planctomycetota bacterium]